MECKTVWAVYWSATDTTKTLVRALAKEAGATLHAPVEVFDFTRPAAREGVRDFEAGDLVFFGVPTYAGRVPNVLLPYLKEQIRGNGALGVPVVLFGNRNYDDSLRELRDVMEADGFHTVAGGAFVGEHAFSRRLGRGRPDEADLALAADFARQVAERARGLTSLPETPVPVAGEDPIRPYYTPRDRAGNPIDIRKVKPKTSAACDHCGLCALLCPMGSIDPEDEGEVTGVCIKCCACEKHCPKGAKFFDDPGYVYHRTELEEGYARRAEVEVFL